MKKQKIKNFWRVVIVIVIFILILWMFKTNIMSSYLSSKMRLPTSIAAISIKPRHTTLYRMWIINPMRSKMRFALSVKKVFLDYRLKNLIKQPTVIDAVELENVVLGVDFSNPSGSKNNWTKIISTMIHKKRKGEYSIRKVVIHNLDVKIKDQQGKILTKHFDNIELKNINSKKGFPTEQLIRAIFSSTGFSRYIQQAVSPQDFFKGVLAPGKNLGENCENLDIDVFLPLEK